MDHPRNSTPPGQTPDDPLEVLLRRQVWVSPPAALRETILDAAAQAALTDQAVVNRHPSPLASHSVHAVNGHSASSERRASRWSIWAERLHSGWTVLAAAWALVVTLNTYSQHASGARTAALPPLSEASLALLRTESRLASMNAAAWDGFEPAASRPRVPPAAHPASAPGPASPQRDKPRARGSWEHRRGLGLA